MSLKTPILATAGQKKVYKDADWPEWIEELFDPGEETIPIRNFDWEILDDTNETTE
jgi:hypothetical protein